MASRNFLGVFGTELGTSQDKAAGGSAGDNNPDEIELGLGLSLGGRFGTDPARDGKRRCLARPSSVASTSSLPGIGGEDLATAVPPPPPLHRTSSLPVESDEARLRRKAMQRQRRLAAKRKLLERRTSMNSSKSSGGFELRRRSSTSLPEHGGSGSDDADADTNSSLSAINTSSDNSGVQNNSLPPASSSGTAGPPSSSSGTQAEQRPSLTTSMRTASTGDFRKTLTEEMPMVFSRLEGPNVNARRVDGFLYRFATAPGDVRIVCVCHGRFLTPAEFVQHAGGGADDLAHPLRHIVVNKQPSEFL